MKPLFIVFEGIDGSGKSTQCSLLYDYLMEEGVAVQKLFEPTDGGFGKEIRNLLTQNTMPDKDRILNLFIQDRREDVAQNILPALKGGKTIVMDRYFFSNAAYQGDKDSKTAGDILAMNMSQGFPKPHRVYFIDVPVETALKRIALRNPEKKTDIFEREDFLKKTRANFLEIADSSFITIDGTKTEDEIHRLIVEDFNKLNERI